MNMVVHVVQSLCTVILYFGLFLLNCKPRRSFSVASKYFCSDFIFIFLSHQLWTHTLDTRNEIKITFVLSNISFLLLLFYSGIQSIITDLLCYFIGFNI